jgi:hypothetical protein
MSIRTITASATAIALAAIAFTAPANAVPLLCQDTTVNHMYVDTSYVSSCLGAGVGNINGNPGTDDFLSGEGAGLGLLGIGSAAFTQTGSTGTFSFDSNLWNDWSSIAVGFKFGTGNQPDEWFVFQLNPSTSSGLWQFVNVFNRGGGLSHVQLYGSGDSTHVPEPGTLGLLGLGLIATTLIRRRKQI